MDQSHKLDYLAGQVNGLTAFLSALIRSHPDLQKLIAEYERTTEAQISMSLPLAVSEEFLQGQNQTRADIDSLLASALAKGL
jgi:hypothetical protein